MANIRIHWMGQSNSVFALTSTFTINILRNTLTSIFDGLHTVTITGQILSNVSVTAPGTAIGGTAISRTGASSNCWMQDDGIPANASAWPTTPIGNLARSYITSTLTTTARSETELIAYYWWEYDSVADGDGATNASVLDAAINELVGTRFRADYGKPAVSLPVLLIGPSLYSSSTFAGQELVNSAFNMLEARSGRNFKRFPCLTKDTWWGRDTSPDNGFTGTDYTAHATDSDLTVHMRRIARFIASEYGPRWGLNAAYSGKGPRINAVQYVNNSTLDVWVRHDGGNNLVLGSAANTTAGRDLWNIYVNGVRTTPVSVAIPTSGTGAGDRVRLAMSTMPGPSAVRLAYGHYTRDNISGGTFRIGRGGLEGGIYDNSHEVQVSANLVLPQSLNGANRVPMPIRDQRTFLTPQVSAPVF